MKKYWLGGLLFIALLLPFSNTYAVSVSGYYRSNGTYVQGYERTAPDGNPYNNYSYPGNYNPNTGSITGGNPQTYLNNYYGTSGTYLAPSPSYSYPVTSSCPINSYSNGSSCTCISGYVVGTDYSGKQVCVSGDSKCTDSMGYGAQFDSLSNTCACRYGYVQSGGKCISETAYCTNSLGLMSQYNSSTKQCECMSSYEFDGSSCVYKSTTYSYPSAYSASAASALGLNCPLNSSKSLADSTKCQCNTGYQPNATKDGCTVIPVKTNDQACSDIYGVNSNWNGTKTGDGQLNCGCQNGYVWNQIKTGCIMQSITTTSSDRSRLTTAQIDSIIGLLQSFGADATVIANVKTSLGR